MVLPSPCLACGNELPWKERVASCCRPCWDSLAKITHSKCSRCAIPWASDQGPSSFICGECQAAPRTLAWIDAWGHYSGTLEAVIHGFKFGRHDFLGGPLGRLMVDTLSERGDFEFDAIVAVPMSPARLRRRGYNQSEILGEAVHKRTGIKRQTLLARKKDNAVQSTLPRAQRAENVRDVFSLKANVQDRSLLLIDDICTTGETLDACARTLIEGGAKRVCALVLARA